MSTHPLGTLIADPVVNGSVNTATGTHFSKLGIGAARQVLTIQERDNIPVGNSLNSDNDTSGMREVNMLVYVAETDTSYRLKIPNWINLTEEQKLVALADNTYWAAEVATSSEIEESISASEKHDHTIYVGGQRFGGNNTTAELDNIDRPFLTINAASDRAKELYEGDAETSVTTSVTVEYVFDGTSFVLNRGILDQTTPLIANPTENFALNSEDFQFIVDLTATNNTGILNTTSSFVNATGDAEFIFGADSNALHFNVKPRIRTQGEFIQGPLANPSFGFNDFLVRRETFKRIETILETLLADKFPSATEDSIFHIRFDLYDVAGIRSLIVVLPDTYNENSIVKNHTDYHFYDGVVVYTARNALSVINDLNETLDDIEISGAGTFLHLNSGEGITSISRNGNLGLVLLRPSNLKIQCKKIDSFFLPLFHKVKLEISDCEIISPRIYYYPQKEIIFKNITFLNGCHLNVITGNRSQLLFDKCQFIVPAHRFSEPENETLNISNYKGDFLFRLSFPDFDYPYDPTITDSDSIVASINANSVNDTLIPHGFAGIAFSGLENEDVRDVSAKFINSKIIIQRSNGIGISLLKLTNNVVGDNGSFIFQNLIIEDEVKQDSIAWISGLGPGIILPDFIFNNVVHNCVREYVPIDPVNLENWTTTQWQKLSL